MRRVCPFVSLGLLAEGSNQRLQGHRAPPHFYRDFLINRNDRDPELRHHLEALFVKRSVVTAVVPDL